jgi:hypothetical protein
MRYGEKPTQLRAIYWRAKEGFISTEVHQKYSLGILSGEVGRIDSFIFIGGNDEGIKNRMAINKAV